MAEAKIRGTYELVVDHHYVYALPAITNLINIEYGRKYDVVAILTLIPLARNCFKSLT